MTSTGQSSFGFHRVGSFMRCPQAFAYHELLGLVPTLENEYSGRGTVLHEALRARSLGLDVGSVIDALPPRYAPHTAEGMRLYRAYCDHYPLDREPFVVLDDEREVEVTIGGRPFTRRVDRIVLWGELLKFVDIKTATRIGARAATADLDWSIVTQEMVGRAVAGPLYGRPWGGVVLDLVQAGASTVEFMRKPITFSERMLASIPRSIDYYYRQIEALSDTDPWSYPRSGKCFEGFKCDYIPLCTHGRAWLRQYERIG